MIVLTATLSATTTVKITDFVCEVLNSVKLVKLAVNEEIEGPVESVFVIVIVSVSVDVYPLWSVTVKVYVWFVVPNEKWSASNSLLQV